jgi:hypothetical protein
LCLTFNGIFFFPSFYYIHFVSTAFNCLLNHCEICVLLSVLLFDCLILNCSLSYCHASDSSHHLWVLLLPYCHNNLFRFAAYNLSHGLLCLQIKHILFSYSYPTLLPHPTYYKCLLVLLTFSSGYVGSLFLEFPFFPNLLRKFLTPLQDVDFFFKSSCTITWTDIPFFLTSVLQYWLLWTVCAYS